jgi:antitoxin component of MazEF toxin-antitoxin module
MAETKAIGVRLPQDLLEQIEAVKGSRTLTQTIVALLQQALGIEPEKPIVERLEALEKKF